MLRGRFPFLLGGTFIEAPSIFRKSLWVYKFPFLLGGTFIEAEDIYAERYTLDDYFPSFWEGLSLRQTASEPDIWFWRVFPFLLGGTFIEALETLIVAG